MKAILTAIDWIAAVIAFFMAMSLAIYIVFVEGTRSIIRFARETWLGGDATILIVIIVAFLWCAFRWKVIRNII